MDKKNKHYWIHSWLDIHCSLVIFNWKIGKLDRGIGRSLEGIIDSIGLFLGLTFLYCRRYNKKEIFGKVFGIVSVILCSLLYMQRLEIF